MEFKGKSKPKSVSKQQVRQMIKSATNNEMNKKYIINDYGVPGSSQTVNSTGTIGSLSTMGQGTTQVTRVGNYAVARKLYYNVVAYPDSNDVSNNIRVIIFSWTDANAAPAMSDVLHQAVNYHVSYYNLNNRENGKLRILKDFSMPVSYGGEGPKCVRGELQLNQKMQWGSSSSTAPVVGGLWVLFVSDSSVATHPYVQSEFVVTIDNE